MHYTLGFLIPSLTQHILVHSQDFVSSPEINPMHGFILVEGTRAAGSDSPGFNPGSLTHWLCDLRLMI